MKSLLAIAMIILARSVHAQEPNHFILAASQTHESEKLSVTWSIGAIQVNWKQTKSNITNVPDPIYHPKVYPNPFLNNIVISHENGKPISVKLINMVGIPQSVRLEENNGLTEVITQDLSSGVYIMLLALPNKKIRSYQLIRQ